MTVEAKTRQPAWLASMRRLPRSAALAFCGILLVAVQAVLEIMEAPAELRLAAVLLVVAMGTASVVDTVQATRLQRREAEREARRLAEDAEVRWTRRVRAALRVWPCPPVSGASLEVLGLKESRLAVSYSDDGGRLSPYVSRDVDRLAQERLRARGMLLIVGAPASGMTRTAYEVACGDTVPRVVLAPEPPDGLMKALNELDVLSRLPPSQRILLWLDRVDRFANGGLTIAMLKECQEKSPGLRVIATISTTRFATWRTEEDSVASLFGEPVRLERLASAPELHRAMELYPGVDFGQGIAAAFTATQELLARLTEGDSSCPYEPAGGDCPLAQRVVTAAIFWANTGTTRPLPMDTLARLVQLSGHPAPDDLLHLAHAVEWASGRTVQYTALIDRETVDRAPPGTAIRANQEIADIRGEEEQPPFEVWEAAIDSAHAAEDYDDVGRIGFQAHARGIGPVACLTWRRITSLEQAGALWLRRAAALSRDRRNPREELPIRQHLLRLTETTHGTDDLEVSDALNRLGSAWLGLGDPGEARNLHERALVIQERELGSNHLEVSDTLNRLGMAWRDLGDPGEARDLHERALAIQERELGSNHLEVSDTLNELGNVWLELRQPGKAGGPLQRALAIRERELGSNHPKVSDTLNRLGNTSLELGDPAQARDLYERALAIREREFGSNHLEVSGTLHNLGMAWLDLGDTDKARDLYERALGIKEREFGPDHFKVSRTLHNLGNAWLVLGDPGEARGMYERALAIQERELGSNHLEVSDTLNSLGIAWMDLGKPNKSRGLYERALAIRERELGCNHLRVTDTLNHLGDSWLALGDREKALGLYEQALRSLHTAHYMEGRPTSPRAERQRRHTADRYRLAAPERLILDDGRIVARHETRP